MADHTQSAPASLSALAQGGHIPILDGWRGLAILLVLQGHFAPLAGWEFDQLGVHAFFGLSGMLMANILFVRATPLRVFYRRRVARIIPAFVFFVTAVFAVAWLAGQHHSATEFVSTLMFLRTYWPSVPDIWGSTLPIGHLWSLNVEEHCYLLLGLLASLGLTRRVLAFALLALSLATVLVFFHYASIQTAPVGFEIRTETAAVFVLTAAGYHLVRPKHLPPLAIALMLVLLAFTALSYHHGAPWWAVAAAAPVVLAVAVNHLDQVPRSMGLLLSWRPLRQVGVWSYSLYLWQQPFYMFKGKLSAPVALAGAMLAALLSFYLIEQPCRRWLARPE